MNVVYFVVPDHYLISYCMNFYRKYYNTLFAKFNVCQIVMLYTAYSSLRLKIPEVIVHGEAK